MHLQVWDQWRFAEFAENGKVWWKMLKWSNRTSLNTYVQYVEDFKFWLLAAGNAHRLPEKEIVKMFVSGLNPEVFRKEIYSRSFEALVDVMAEKRHELANYRDNIEIFELSVRNPRRTRKIRAQTALYPGNKGSPERLRMRRVLRKRRRYLTLRRQWIWRMWNVSSATRKNTMPTNARMQRARMK